MNNRVELDRLADYAAGVLDGTPQAEEIAHLIVADQAWTAAYTELVDVDRAVRGELAALRTGDEPMPTEVAARLDAALAAAAVDRLSTAGSGDPAPDTRSRAAGTHRADRPRSRTDGRTPGSSARTRRRRRAWMLAAVAAGVLALGGVGVPVLTEAMRSRGGVATDMAETQTSGRGEGLSAPAPPVAGPLGRAPVLLASGTNYSPADLASLAARRSGAAADEAPGATGDTQQLSGERVPPALRGFLDPAVRTACLQQLTAAYGGFVETVDLAQFEGEPALVVVLTDATARPIRVVVAGPACGHPASGGDTRRTVTVG